MLSEAFQLYVVGLVVIWFIPFASGVFGVDALMGVGRVVNLLVV